MTQFTDQNGRRRQPAGAPASSGGEFAKKQSEARATDELAAATETFVIMATYKRETGYIRVSSRGARIMAGVTMSEDQATKYASRLEAEADADVLTAQQADADRWDALTRITVVPI